MKESISKFEKLIYLMIEKSKEKVKNAQITKKFDDFTILDYMVDSNLNETNEEIQLKDIELRDNSAVLFVAGHETSSVSLTFVILLLAKHEEIQEKARNEIKEIIGDNELTFELVKKLEFIPSIIKESLRLYPSAINIPPKQASKDVEIGGYTIPKVTHLPHSNLIGN
jgi:cytochrome P450